MTTILNREDLSLAVKDALAKCQIVDMHTHVFSPPFGDLLLWGVDELVTYHYLVAELFRYRDLEYEAFWAMSKREQADVIWQTLFVENSPISEATRGVITVLQQLGIDISGRSLEPAREFFASQTVESYVGRVLELAGVESVVMTNDPFDPTEAQVWRAGVPKDERFQAALRLDGLLNDWEKAHATLSSEGYAVDKDFGGKTVAEIRRFLDEWIEIMSPLYMAVSLPPDFAFPEDSPRGRLIAEAVLPTSLERGLPFAMMIGVKKLINPALRLAGDAVGKADIKVIEHLCVEHPDNRFLVTMLSRENQHELCIAARKYRNLMIFGCWWFLNDPSIIDEMTRERLELLGTSFVPQHSDARVLDQLIYKWKHSREIIGEVLIDKYSDLLDAGWFVTREDIARDVKKLFVENFQRFVR